MRFGVFLGKMGEKHGVSGQSIKYKMLKKHLKEVKTRQLESDSDTATHLSDCSERSIGHCSTEGNNTNNSYDSSPSSDGAESATPDPAPQLSQQRPPPTPATFISLLEEELVRVNQIVKQKLKVLQRVRKALVAARQVRGYKEAQEHGIVLIQLSNVYDDVILVLWFMYLNSIAVSKIVKKYNKNVPSSPYTVDPSRWLFMSTGLAHAQRAKASIEAEYAACVDSLPGEGETTLVERNKEVSELAKGMKALMQEHKHHLHGSWDPTEWAVIPSLESMQQSQARRTKAPSMVSFLWQSSKEVFNIDEPNLTREYQLGSVIGRGAYGVVCKATHKATGALMAVKTIHDTWSHPILGQRSYREIQILQQLRHPNIIELTDVVLNKNKKDVHLIMPYIPHTCEDLLVRRQLLAEHKKWFMLQLLSALAYIHERGVVHRDLKLSNILVDETPRCYLSDFGLARTLSSGTETTTNDNPDYIQTQWYRAPEVLLCSRTTTAAADMWSMGCILAELLTGVPLFPGQDQQQQLELILACCAVTAGPLSLEAREKFPPSLLPAEMRKDPLHAIDTNMKGDGEKRARRGPSNLVPRRSICDVISRCAQAGHEEVFPLEHAHDLIQKLLRFEPSDRLSAKAAIEHPWFTAEPRLSGDGIRSALRSAKPCYGEGSLELELTCTKLHSAAAYREAVERSPKVVSRRREQEMEIELHQAAALIQQFWRWRRKGGERPGLDRTRSGGSSGHSRRRSSASTVRSVRSSVFKERRRVTSREGLGTQLGNTWWCYDPAPRSRPTECFCVMQ